MNQPQLPEITDEFLRQGAEYLICHAYRIFSGKEFAEGVWADWEFFILQEKIRRPLWLWIVRNLSQLAGQYSDDDWACFIWAAVKVSAEHGFTHALVPQDEIADEIAPFLRQFYELVLLPRCVRDVPQSLMNDGTASKLDGACYMIGEDFGWLDDLPDAIWQHLQEALEYALHSPSFTLQHSALHALGHLHRSKTESISKWRTKLIQDWLHNYDSGFGVNDLPREAQQRLRRSAFLIESQGRKRRAELNHGRTVPQELVLYARAALKGSVL